MARSSSTIVPKSYHAEASGVRSWLAVRGESLASTALKPSSPNVVLRNCLRLAKITPLILAISGLAAVRTSLPSRRGTGPEDLRSLSSDTVVREFYLSTANPSRIHASVPPATLHRSGTPLRANSDAAVDER